MATDRQREQLRLRAQDAHRQLIEQASAHRWSEEDPVRLDRLIIGGGLAATLDWATRQQPDGTGLVLARAEEPWWSRNEWSVGQPVSELVSEGFEVQPHDFADDRNGFAPASALANAIAVTAFEKTMPLVIGCCVDQPIERTDDGRFVVHLGERRIEAGRVDVAVGLGPPRRLRDTDGNATIVSAEDERILLADGRMVFGQEQWRQPVRGPHVLVIGGGATAAWNVEMALQLGTMVTWIAPPSPSDALEHRQNVRACEDALNASAPIDDEQRRQLERRRARLVAFHKADLPRNQAVFDSPDVALWVGTALRLSPLADRVEASLLRGGGTVTQEFDQVIVSIGQDDRAPEAAASLVAKLPMTWLEYDERGIRAGAPPVKPSGRIIGACAADEPERLRCLGVPLLYSKAWQDRLDESQPRKSLGRNPFRARLKRQIDAAPACSKGIEGAVFHVSANVVFANGTAVVRELGAERYLLLLSTIREELR